MKKVSLLLVMAIMVFNLSANEGIQFEKISLEQALNKAKTEGKNVFIDIYATWCGPCKYLSKSVFTDKELGNFMNDNFICLKLDGEQSDGEGLMYEFELDSYPTMLFLDPDKKLLKKIVGAVGSDEILHKAKGIASPETTDLYKSNKRYEKGDRSKEFLLDHIETLALEEQDYMEVVNEYLKLFPNLDLDSEKEFMVFALSDLSIDSEYSKEFIQNVNKYNNSFPEFSQVKTVDFVLKAMNNSIKDKNKSTLEDFIKYFYPTYKSVFGKDALEKEEFTNTLVEAYESKLE